MFRTGRAAGVFLSLACGILSLSHADPPPPDRTTWEAVDIVPMPKRIRLTGAQIPLSGAVIILGARPSEQDRIGAKWINDHIIERGGTPLPIVQEPAPSQVSLRIYVGARETSTTIDRAARDGAFKLGPGVPGERGYVIYPRKAAKVTEVLLGGADAVGALYACVTFAGLLDNDGGTIVVREAEVVDWPDYQTFGLGMNLAFPELDKLCRQLYFSGSSDDAAVLMRAMQRNIDRLLSWKVSCRVTKRHAGGGSIVYYWSWDKMNPAFLKAIRDANLYALARGIRTMPYCWWPFAGRVKDFPNTPKRCLTGVGRHWTGYLRCWSMDEERRQTARRIGRQVRDAAVTELFFHDADVGGYFNPAGWDDRCDVCRKRWGNDYGAATINKHRIFYDEIKKLAPNCRIHFSLKPYCIYGIMQRSAERYLAERFGPGPNIPAEARRMVEDQRNLWQRFAKGFPADVTFAIREGDPQNIPTYKQLTAPHGTHIWYQVGARQWQAFFDESPRWAPTWYSGPRDVMLTNVRRESLVPLLNLATREYAWNSGIPGAGVFARRRTEPLEQWRHAEPGGEIFSLVLPHVARNLFGRRAAPAIVRAASCNVAFNQIFDHHSALIAGGRAQIKTYKTMKWQADQAQAGGNALDALYKDFAASKDGLGMTPYARRAFIYMREVFHTCKWMAQAKAQNLLARELATAGKAPEARKAIARGREVIPKARADMEKLIAQRPADPIYNPPLASYGRPFPWKRYAPDSAYVDFSVPEKLLAQSEKQLPMLAATGTLHPHTLKRLANRSYIHVPRAAGKILVDGRLTEPQWRGAFPVEAFFADGKTSLARADTRVYLMRDDKTLYLGAICSMPAKAPILAQPRTRDGDILKDEAFELFLMPPHMKGGYVHFFINAVGSLRDDLITLKPNRLGKLSKNIDRSWNAEHVVAKTSQREGAWELEMAIPLAAIGAASWNGKWHANLCRSFKGEGNFREDSSIQPPGTKSFHNTSTFPFLDLRDIAAPPPDASLTAAGFSTRLETLADRVATTCSIGLTVSAARILHNVHVSAECYGKSGKLERRKALVALERIPFRWTSRHPFTVSFENEVTSGAVRLVLESEEVRKERWVRIGGWPGAHTLCPVLGKAEFPDARSGGFLQGECYFASRVRLPAEKQSVSLFSPKHGAVEFWFKPAWHTVPGGLRGLTAWYPEHVLFHFGIVRRPDPHCFNTSALTISYDTRSREFRLGLAATNYTGWGASAPWKADQAWHHLACVWDLTAEPSDRLRIYIDGTRASDKTYTPWNPERITPATCVDTGNYVVQLGSLNTGRYAAPVLIDDLRISRTARYADNFTPEPGDVDNHTSMLLLFNDTLEGEGVTPKGEPYRLRAIPGHIEYH